VAWNSYSLFFTPTPWGSGDIVPEPNTALLLSTGFVLLGA